nr:MAG TPA: HNH endonuclease bacteriophage, HNH Endonuclease, DNA.52A [Caudoviricetes sp.]
MQREKIYNGLIMQTDYLCCKSIFYLVVYGMAKAFAIGFYKSKKWQDCRQSFIAERMLVDGGLCQLCKERHGYIVHHKIMIDESNVNNPDVTLNHENLMYVCKKCHDNLPGHGIGCEPKKYFFDESGMLQPIIPPVEKLETSDRGTEGGS